MRRARSPFLAATVLIAANAAAAADLGAAHPSAIDPFAPARPVGVAAVLPRSPLADATVFGNARFATEAEAAARCPGDVVVRVEALVTTYRRASPSGAGAFMCRSSALSEGDLPR